MSKRTMIVGLLGLNLLLFLALVLGSYHLPAAYAQTGARAGDFACVTAKAAGQSFDVVYVLDRSEKKLHAFAPTNIQTKKHKQVAVRDLKADFGK